MFSRQVKNIGSGPALTGEVHKQCAVHTAETLSGSSNVTDSGNFALISSVWRVISVGVHGRILDEGAAVLLCRPAKRKVALGVYGRFSQMFSCSLCVCRSEDICSCFTAGSVNEPKSDIAAVEINSSMRQNEVRFFLLSLIYFPFLLYYI